MMSTGDLLQVFPAELKFSYELKKTSSCLMQLGNKTDHYVAYKVKTTNPKKYCVRPNAGIVLPGSTCDVTVTMQAPKETTSDYNCKDRFLLQCVVAEHGATLRDITSDMFTKKPGKVVEEFKFKVVYIPSSPPSPVPEDPEEGLSPLSSTSENGSQNLLFDAALFSKNQDFKYAKARSSTCAQPGGDASEWMLINKLAKEKDSEIQLHQKLLQEVELLRKEAKRVQGGGFSAMILVLVGLLGVMVGYIMG